MAKRIPVILDTDIGGDIDDTWALGLLLQCPELDLKLVTTCTGDTEYRARVAAKFLQAAGRTDVPVATGPRENQKEEDQAPWVAGYSLSDYPGEILPDAAAAIADCVLQSPEPVAVLAIGPLSVVAEALDREPRIAHGARLMAMGGNVVNLHEGCDEIIPEYNIKRDVPGARRVFTAPWDITLAPLDACGRFRVTGERYSAVRDSAHPVARAIIENYRPWFLAKNWEPYDFDKVTMSSILFDTVPVYLAFAHEFFVMQDHSLTIRDDGLTAIDPAGACVHCAVDWKNMPGFEAFVANRLTGND